MTPLPRAAIGRLLSRMPVIIRSHEGSADKITVYWGWGIKIVTYQPTILQAIDIKSNYFHDAKILSPSSQPFERAG
jgi:hypothetical protein